MTLSSLIRPSMCRTSMISNWIPNWAGLVHLVLRISDSLILSHRGHGLAIFPADEWLLMVSSYLQVVSSTKRILFVGVGARVFLEAFSDYCTLVLPKRMESLRW